MSQRSQREPQIAGASVIPARVCRTVCGLALSLSALLTPAAFGQAANGDGSGLKANLHRFSNNFGSRDSFGANRFQNSILYGNAPGGLSFQGNLGYKNPYEFQGKLGSNDLYKFNRDSTFSSLAGSGLSGGKLQDYQGALARGERGLSAGLGGVFDVQRQGTSYGGNSGPTFTPRSGGGRRDPFASDTFRNVRIGNSLINPSASTGGAGDADTLASRSQMRSTLESTLTANLGQRRSGTSFGASSLTNAMRGAKAYEGDADRMLNSSLGNARSDILDRNLTENDRAMGLSGAATDASRTRARPNAANTTARAGSPANSNKVQNLGPAGVGPENAVPQVKSSYDELRERLEKMQSLPSPPTFDKPGDTTPSGEPGSTPDLKPDAKPDGTAPGSTAGIRPIDRLGVPGTAVQAPRQKADWEVRMDDLRTQLGGPSASPGRVTLLGPKAKARGFADPSKAFDTLTPAGKPGTDARPDKPRDGSTPRAATGLEPKSRAGAEATKGVSATDRSRDPGTTEDPAMKSRIDPKTLQLIRDAGARVESLKPSVTGGRDFFVEHMQKAQELLADSMFFDAEERFAQAIESKPADPTGHIGRIHAQMGAGLFMSAGGNLRKLLYAHPEATGQRYAEALLPPKKRIDQIALRLRENLRPQAAAGPIRRDSALLLTYIGFQTTNRAIAEEGLDAMAKSVGQDPDAKPGEDEKLIELLRGVWLDEKFYRTEPDAGEAPAAKPEPPSEPKK